MRVGVTGHSNLAPESEKVVADAIREVLTGFAQPIVGVSCLARGADQVFARVVLELGGQLEVVLPAADYRERKVKPDNRADFDALVAQAADVRVLPFEQSGREAYVAASEAVLSSVEALVAVWDGTPADGRGGTADVVAVANDRGLPVHVVWPEGAHRVSS